MGLDRNRPAHISRASFRITQVTGSERTCIADGSGRHLLGCGPWGLIQIHPRCISHYESQDYVSDCLSVHMIADGGGCNLLGCRTLGLDRNDRGHNGYESLIMA